MTARSLTDFLLARIAGDEADAHAEDRDCAGTTLLPSFDSDHQARWTTDRVLAECEAKRRIVEVHRHDLATRGCCEEHGGVVQFMDCDIDWEAGQYAELGGWCKTVRLLALPYADHPDYQESWRP